LHYNATEKVIVSRNWYNWWICLSAFLFPKNIVPSPIVCTVSEVYENNIDEKHSHNPKTQIKFGNAGNAPMFIHSMELLANGKSIDSFKSILTEEKFVITSESSKFFLLNG
jgi:hypothetical protein